MTLSLQTPILNLGTLSTPGSFPFTKLEPAYGELARAGALLPGWELPLERWPASKRSLPEGYPNKIARDNLWFGPGRAGTLRALPSDPPDGELFGALRAELAAGRSWEALRLALMIREPGMGGAALTYVEAADERMRGVSQDLVRMGLFLASHQKPSTSRTSLKTLTSRIQLLLTHAWRQALEVRERVLSAALQTRISDGMLQVGVSTRTWLPLSDWKHGHSDATWPSFVLDVPLGPGFAHLGERVHTAAHTDLPWAAGSRAATDPRFPVLTPASSPTGGAAWACRLSLRSDEPPWWDPDEPLEAAAGWASVQAVLRQAGLAVQTDAHSPWDVLSEDGLRGEWRRSCVASLDPATAGCSWLRAEAHRVRRGPQPAPADPASLAPGTRVWARPEETLGEDEYTPALVSSLPGGAPLEAVPGRQAPERWGPAWTWDLPSGKKYELVTSQMAEAASLIPPTPQG